MLSEQIKFGRGERTEMGIAAAIAPIETMLEQTKWKAFFHSGTGYSSATTSATTVPSCTCFGK
jgi:hypothetical protein